MNALSQQTRRDIYAELHRLSLFAALYARCALDIRYRRRWEWYEAQVARFDERTRCLRAALRFAEGGCA